MAIPDLLWACPLCSSFHSLRRIGREAQCATCSARLRRENGSLIAVVDRNGATTVRSVVEWEALLPPIDHPGADGVLGPEPVTLRYGLPARPVREGGRLIGWAERFGPLIHATARLDQDGLAAEELGAGAALRHWRLEDLTAIQPSSSALQLNTRQSLVSIRFLTGCVRRWEAVLCRRLREHAERLGRGPIHEFQPRIRYG